MENSNKVVTTCGCVSLLLEEGFGIVGYFGKGNEEEDVAKLIFALRYNQFGPYAPSNNCAELEAIEKIVDIGVVRGISGLEIRTDLEFSITNLRIIRAWNKQK